MSTAFIAGKMEKYVAQREFTLNFEDRNIKSVKVRLGSEVLYDGVTAQYTAFDGVVSSGKCPSLKSAIDVLAWLLPANGKAADFSAPVTSPTLQKVVKRDVIPIKEDDYDSKIGGSFDTMMKSEGLNGEKKMAVVRQEDRVIRKIPEINTGVDNTAGVVEDQSPVRENLTVNSSTTNPRTVTHSAKVIRQEESNTRDVGTMRLPAKAVGNVKKKIVVDSTTPSIPEDATAEEVKRITSPVVQSADQSQESVVVKKIRKAPSVIEIEGVVLRKTKSVERPATARTGSVEMKPITASVVKPLTVSKEEVTVVKTISPKPDAIDALNVPPKPSVVNNNQVIASDPQDYMSLLPESWGDMHWTQKEVFVLNLNDKGFIEFIMSVETIKAVLNACTERLKQLEGSTAA